jgi:hypothetical protein
MKIEQTIRDVFHQLTDALQMLSDEQYSRRNKILFNASLGQHVRHIIELFVCLYDGYETGLVNYEKRKRDVRIESDKDLAIELMQMITNNLDKSNRDLLLESGYDDHTLSATVATNYYREIIYNLEHTVHHMALIRIGINEVSTITLPDGFGVASSTIKYRTECAQ